MSQRSRGIAVVLALAFLWVGHAAFAGTEGLVLTDDLQMALGQAFFDEGDYYRAITEYKKLRFLFPQSKRLSEALFRIGMAYYRGEDYPAAADSFAKVRQTYTADYFSDAAFYEGLSYVKLGRHDDAALAFERARWFDETHPTAAMALIGLSLNAVARGDTVACRDALTAFVAGYPADERLPAVRGAFTLLDEYDHRPKKSPLLAGALSTLLPGSGQMYARHYTDGLMALVVNGLFIAGTVVALENENYAVGAIVGAVGLPFYFGNIYGAANSARKWNLALANDLNDRLALSFGFRY